MDAEWNDPDDGWFDELDYQPQGPFCTQRALETHRVFLDRGVVTSLVGLSTGPSAGQEPFDWETDSAAYASAADSEGYDSEAEQEADDEKWLRQMGGRDGEKARREWAATRAEIQTCMGLSVSDMAAAPL